MVSSYHTLNLLSIAAMHENVARYKLPAVGDGREVLTSAARLKYFHKASIYPPRVHVEQKNLD